MTPRELALAIFRDALAALDPRALVRDALRGVSGEVELWAVGKAAVAMAAGVGDAVAVRRSLVVGPGDAGHPVADARSVEAGAALLARAAALREEDQVVLVLSGGASAMCVAPVPGLSLEEKVAAVGAVMVAGAPIGVVNAVRKHLSRIKGGRLAAATAARVRTLILSDVVGDDVSVIGSGPTVGDPTTVEDAARAPGLPAWVRGLMEETPKPGDPRLGRVDVKVLAGPHDLARAAAVAAARRGVRVAVEAGVVCSVEELAARLVARARAGVPTVMTGEPVIALPARPGRGGRAQQTALLVARQLVGGAVVLCVGSDGRDGPTGDAGGLVDAGTVGRVAAAGLDVDRALRECDAGAALAAADDLVTVGVTGTNLCDLYLVLAERS